MENTNKANSRSPSCTRLQALILGMIILAATGVGVFYILDRSGIQLQKNSISSVEFLGTVSSAELQAHDVPDDCWLVIHGNAYDLTEYALTHPGGAGFITDYCGTDATRAYDREHSESLLQTVDFLRLGVFSEETPGDAAASTGQGGTGATYPDNSSQYVPCSDDHEGEDDSDDCAFETPRVQQTAKGTTSPPSQEALPCIEQVYTFGDVATHADQGDCWYVLYNVIYDLTDYVDRHPGGARRVFQECGTDATAVYSSINKHNEQLLVKESMSRYKIGLLGSLTGLMNTTCSP